MKEVVFLLIITIIILGFLSGDIIPLFRSSMDVIGTVAQKEYEGQKIKSSDLLSLEKKIVRGGDVISTIRFFKDNPNVTVEVTIGTDTVIYTTNTYNQNQLNIFYNKLFQSEYIYSGDKLEKVIYIEK